MADNEEEYSDLDFNNEQNGKEHNDHDHQHEHVDEQGTYDEIELSEEMYNKHGPTTARDLAIERKIGYEKQAGDIAGDLHKEENVNRGWVQNTAPITNKESRITAIKEAAEKYKTDGNTSSRQVDRLAEQTAQEENNRDKGGIA